MAFIISVAGSVLYSHEERYIFGISKLKFLSPDGSARIIPTLYLELVEFLQLLLCDLAVLAFLIKSVISLSLKIRQSTNFAADSFEK